MMEYYSAETADASRSPNTLLGQSASSMICPDCNEQNLREKALMYAVQAYGAEERTRGVTFFAFADLCYCFLSGDDAFLRGDAK